nr:hypothetical protein [Paraburkholderia aromaticivorans]
MKVKRIVANIETQEVNDAKRFYQDIFGLELLFTWASTWAMS